MDFQTEELYRKAKTVIEEGSFDLFLEDMQNDIALKIIRSKPDQKEEREEWYVLAQNINGLKAKLQEYANEYDKTQEAE